MGGYTLIDEAGQLADALDRLDPGLRWAVDTEFVRERTYYARLCLVQAAVGADMLLVDPLRIEDEELLRRFLGASGEPRVLHAARQDIEVLLPLTGDPLAPLVRHPARRRAAGLSRADRLRRPGPTGARH